MKKKAYQVAFPAILVVVMVAFLSTIFLASTNLSFAASGKKRSSIARMSAVDHTEAQIKQLQGALNFTDSQQGLWDNLAQVMRENAKEMDAFRDARQKERAEGTKTLNAVEHMKYHRQITDMHLNQLQKLIPPFEALYSTMSDQQKNVTDIIFRTGRHGKQKRR